MSETTSIVHYPEGYMIASRPLRSFLFLLALLALAAPLAAQERRADIGMRAPAAALETLEGAPTNLSRYVGQRPTLIEFWATWCSLCAELEPRIRAAQRRYGSRVRFVGVAVGVNQSPARVKAFAARHRLPLEILYDRRGTAVTAYEVPATSYVVVIDRNGRIVYTGQGGDQDIEAAIRKAL